MRFVDADFESPDGSDLVLDADLTGARLDESERHAPGPIAALASGATSRVVVSEDTER